MDVIVVNKNDNVATALRPLEKGYSINIKIGGIDQNIVMSQFIPFGHKFALRDLVQGEPVIKYGEIIGLTTMVIARGALVHVYNVEGQRGRGDRNGF